MANQITAAAVRKIIKSDFVYANYKLAALRVYPDIDQAKAVIYSRNLVFYEVWFIVRNGKVVPDKEMLLVPWEEVKNAEEA